jgi:serine/threonine protein kinase
MNNSRAKQLEKQLAGLTVEAWTIECLINHGKSAAVFKANSKDGPAAVKVFDAELIDKHGAEVQAERIEREKTLINKVHPNLVRVFGGGYWKEQQLFYVVMEYLPWKNLTDVLREIPVGSERKIIAQVALAAQFLEGLEICHRDIKPENIAISTDFQHVKLLDLGVIRPHGTKPLTDGTGGKIFVGTLKYSPPEFLLRQEKDTDSWRAISFYQLGGVLHDLIMRRSLFADFENPFALLVNAVQHETPRIESKAVSPALVDLARCCLLKKFEVRLQLVTWKLFEDEPSAPEDLEGIKSQIIRRNQATQSEKLQAHTATDAHAIENKLDKYREDLHSACIIACIDEPSIFPPVEVRTVVKTIGVRQLFAQFEPSAQHCLTQFLRVEFLLKWLDSSGDVCEVLTSNYSSSTAHDKKKPCGDCTITIFKGIYAPDTVRRAVTETLYRAVHAAQATASSTEPGGRKTLDFRHEPATHAASAPLSSVRAFHSHVSLG